MPTDTPATSYRAADASCQPRAPGWERQPRRRQPLRYLEAAVAGHPQRVTKRGKPAVVVLAVDEYQRLRCLEEAAAPAFADMLLAVPPDDEEFERLRLGPRQVDF